MDGVPGAISLLIIIQENAIEALIICRVAIFIVSCCHMRYDEIHDNFPCFVGVNTRLFTTSVVLLQFLLFFCDNIALLRYIVDLLPTVVDNRDIS